jgi:hypothetical protein
MHSLSYHSTIVLWYLIYEYIFFSPKLLLKGEDVRQQGTQATLLEHICVDQLRDKGINRVPLILDLAQYTSAAGLTEQARFTSPEFHSDTHQYVHKHWLEIAAICQISYRSNRHIELPCTAGNCVWKRWL